jgi:asparagine synthase (glutamine-hydrolysing)
LSGGLDSSTIVGLARKIQTNSGGDPFATFSGISEDVLNCRESRYCRKVCEQGGLDAAFLRPSDVAEFEDRLHQLDEISEDPFDNEWIHHRMIHLAARSKGIVAVMDGIDGDGVASLTSVYPAYLLRKGHFLAANRELLGQWKNYHRRTVPLWKVYSDSLRLAMVPEFARKLKQRIFPQPSTGLESYPYFSEKFVSKMRVDLRLRDFHQRTGLGKCRTLRDAHARRISAPYLTAGIERYARIAATCGTEQRQPLLDLRVVEFCLSLPWDQKCRHGWSKYGLRKVAERVLPADVAWRTGWDSILWKFCSVRNVLERERGLKLAGCNNTLKKWAFETEKFEELLNQVKIGDIDAAEHLSSYVNLLKWLRQNSASGELV